MKMAIITIYLIIGLLVGHHYFKKATKRIEAEIESGEIGKDSEYVITKSEQLSSAIGHKNFMAVAYVMFAVVWLPAIIYARFIK